MDQQIEFLKQTMQHSMDSFALEVYNCILSSNRKKGITEFKPIPLSAVLDLARVFFGQLKEQPQNFDVFISVVQETIRLIQTSEALNTCCKFVVEMDEVFTTTSESILLLRFAHQILRSFRPPKDGELMLLEDDFVDLVITQMFSNEKNVRLWSFMCASYLINNLQRIEVLSKIWERLKSCKNETTILDILAQFIELFLDILNICADPFFWETLLNALANRSDTSDVKRKVLYILEKILKYTSTGKLKSKVMVDGYFEWDQRKEKEFENSWRALITVLANLEERQSHLILPSLEMLENVNVPFFWKEALLADVLMQKNNLVLKSAVECVLKKYKCVDLSSKTLKYLIEAMNNTFLYVENPGFLETAKNSFKGDVSRVVGIFCLINWKAVPMHALLTASKCVKSETEMVSPAIILEIAACIRRTQHKAIRNKMSELFFEMFKNDLQHASLQEFFNICDALSNEIIGLESIGSTILNRKLCNWTGDLNLSRRHFVIVLIAEISVENISRCMKDFVNSDMLPTDLLDVLNWTNWMGKDPRIFLEFVDLFEKHSHILKKYDVIINNEQYFTRLLLKIFKNEYHHVDLRKDLEFMKRYFENKPISHLEQHFIQKSFASVVEKETIFLEKTDFKWLFSRAKGNTKSGIRALSVQTYEAMEIEEVLEKFREIVQMTGIAECRSTLLDFFKYSQRLGARKFVEVVAQILDYDRHSPIILGAVFDALYKICTAEFDFAASFILHQDIVEGTFLDLFIDGLLFGQPLIGEQKIDFDYCLQNNIPLYYNPQYNAAEVRNSAIKVLHAMSAQYKGKLCLARENFERFFENLMNKLLHMSHTMSVRKSRYFGDSMHHRQKLRIVQALAVIQNLNKHWDRRFLDIVFKENNQTNVTYIGELLIADSIPRDELTELLQKTKDLTPSSLCSLFFITYLACRRLEDPKLTLDSMKVIAPWTMGANFQVRTSAQMAIYHMHKAVSKEENIETLYLYHAIDETLKQVVEENMKKDFRWNGLDCFSLLEEGNILVHIPRITNMASDELIRNYECADKSSLASIEKMAERTKDGVKEHNCLIQEVQKKMNPVQFEIGAGFGHLPTDILLQEEPCKMIVVASLISKTPNLGGIARTCEVLGINNLVLDSLKHAKCKEFQSLSMTAEKWLNLQEVKPDKLQDYLIDKKLEGYSIIGAEQTSNSVNFVDFKFPDKCVLLLGQEKEGIPANLLSFLDFAVEIPQLGMVRSLNVHVTGALFMWEYFKEHKYKKDES